MTVRQAYSSGWLKNYVLIPSTSAGISWMSSVLNCNQKARDPQSGVEGHITYLRLILRMIIKKKD